MEEVSPVISNWKYVQITKQSDHLPTPQHATPGSAGVDLASAHYTEVDPGETVLVDTGIAFSIPEGYYLDLRQRSGLSIEYPNYLANCCGVIDSDFRGTIKCIIHNTSNHVWRIQKGDKIAQVILTPYMPMRLVAAQTLTNTQRGEGGFGSTGVK
jgi:dUTP pyrophosphatase